MNFLIEWFARHHIAANMLVLATIIGGILAAKALPKEIIPHIEPNSITITTSLPGANPALIESSLCTPIEIALKRINAIHQTRSTSQSNQCIVNAELDASSDVKKTVTEIDAAINLVPLPPQATQPVISNTLKDVMIMRLSVSGKVDYNLLRSNADRIAVDLQAQGISKTNVIEAKTQQIVIEVPQMQLQQYQISLAEIAQALRQNSLNIPAGHITSAQGISSVVINSGNNDVMALENTIVRSMPDGTQLRLGDIASIHDEFSGPEASVNGEPSVAISIYQGTNSDLFEISDIVLQYVERSQDSLPPGVKLLVVFDNAQFFNARMSYLKSNFLSGLIVSSFILLIWLRFRLAFWITADIPIAFGGGLIWLYLMGGSINMVSAFGLIIVLGIVCDDAIVIGENIYRHQCAGKPGLEGAITGVKEVSRTVIFAVSTTILMFIPLLFLPGSEGKLMQPLPVIVIAILIASLIEAMLVLPTHLSHTPKKQQIPSLGYAIAEKMDNFVLHYYRPLLAVALKWRYLVITLCFSLFIISVSLVFSGIVKVHFFSSIETEIATGAVSYPHKNDSDKAKAAVKKMEQAALELKKDLYNEFGIEQIKLVRTFIANNAVHGEVYLSLATSGERKIDSATIMQRWKEKTGILPEATELSFNATVQLEPDTFNILLTSNDFKKLQEASSLLKQQLMQYDGVLNSRDTFSQNHEEVSIELTPDAFELGLTLETVSRQVHMALEGTPLPKLNNKTVVLTIPREERSSLWQLENLPIQINPLHTVPLTSIATLSFKKAPDHILHINGETVSSISADINENIITRTDLMARISDDLLKDIGHHFPGVAWKKSGTMEAEVTIKRYLMISFAMSLLAMFIMLAIFLNSYFQPLMIFTAIPFGIVGALFGHFIFDHQLTLWSLAGMIAVSGIVVNNNMVIIFFINERVNAGEDLTTTLLRAGSDRFRPIMLTTITTFAGVFPTIAGNSWEAQFLIPLAISISCGVVFAALLTLFLVPCIYLVSHDMKNGINENAKLLPVKK